ncbi:hypothetical protein HELRODRAFT_164838 [Helobdella robusta]|uniref:Uncharacterized protein n=1 Tax=Helobdella robusta TaxID=6412 RepID=T1EVV3_HELRO|nr:hypothetical protein HELRODRAFT_164838 [Helobdella robusta]ESN92739.1 hypothetical protein HELRODRAFT_164838 [Helobdella robusta]
MKSCLEAFEKLTRQRTCPLCRCSDYETRLISSARPFYLNKCAMKIQSTWKMYRCMKVYEEHLRNNPPKHPTLKKKYFEGKLSSIVDKVVATVNLDVDGLMEEMNTCITRSRRINRKLMSEDDDVDWAAVKIKKNGFYNNDTNSSSNESSRSSYRNASSNKTNKTKIDCTDNNVNIHKNNNKKKIHKTKINRNINANNATSNNIFNGNNNDENNSLATKPSIRSTSASTPFYILSCSHVYHKPCFDTLEMFAIETLTASELVCPVIPKCGTDSDQFTVLHIIGIDRRCRRVLFLFGSLLESYDV